MKAIIISAITLTGPTRNATGLLENQFAELMAMPLTDAQKNNLSVKVELQQQSEGAAVERFGLANMMKGHDKVSSAERFKRYWFNAVNLATVIGNAWTVGSDFTAICEGQGFSPYLLTTNSTVAKQRLGRITSSPKRKGKGGDVLLTTKGELIFQDTALVYNNTPREFADFADFAYDDFVTYEQDALIVHDKENVIAAADAPVETKQDGFFTGEFEQWLIAEYAKRNLGVAVLQELA